MAMVMIAAILGHIYIGTIGMEGAFEAMGTGRVDYNWAREHHSLWVEEEMAKARRGRGCRRRAVPRAAGRRALAGDSALRVIGLAGWSGAGKTTLLARLIPCLSGRGSPSRRSSTRTTPSTWTSRARIPGCTGRRGRGRCWSARRTAGR